MITLDDFLRADLPPATSAADPMAFRIDSMMRIVSIPETAAVLGVEGDKNVNRVVFRAPRMYRDEDLSTFSSQISYTNAAGESGFYPAGKPRVDGDEVEVSWLVDEPALRYVGDVAFSVKFFAADEKGVVSKQYSTTTAKARCLDGVDADRELPVDRLANLETQLAGVVTNASAKANAAAARAEAAIAQLPLPTGNILRGEAAGKVAHADDAYSATPLGLSVYGASVQDGIPTPAAPKQVASVKSAELRISGDDADALHALPLDLRGHELRSLPDGVRDEVRIDEEGNVELVQRVGKATLDGSESWEHVDGSSFSFRVALASMAAISDAPSQLVCSSHKPMPFASTSEATGLTAHEIHSKNLLCFRDVQHDGIESFRSALAASPTTMLYPLAAPNIVPLGKVAMPLLPAPIANACVESDVPTECAVKYVRDVNMVIGRLEQKLAAVTTAAI